MHGETVKNELYLVHAIALISLFDIKSRLMHTYINNIILLTLCHSDMFQPSKDHHQGVRQIHFNSKVNNTIYQTSC